MSKNDENRQNPNPTNTTAAAPPPAGPPGGMPPTPPEPPAAPPADLDADVRAAAHERMRRHNEDVRAAALNARSRGRQEQPVRTGESIGDGYRLQNVSEHAIDGIPPGGVQDVSHWSKKKLDRVVDSAAGRKKDLVILGPEDSARIFEEPNFPKLSLHKEADAVTMIQSEENREKLRYWAAEDPRPFVVDAIRDRFKALKARD